MGLDPQSWGARGSLDTDLDRTLATAAQGSLPDSLLGGAGSLENACCGPIRSAGEYRSLGARQISIDLARVEKQWSGARRRLLS